MMMKPYHEYRDTPALWIDSIPYGWQSKKVRELFTERRTKVSDKDYSALSVCKAGIVPQLATAVKTDSGDNRKLVKKGDYVINSRSDRKGSSGISLYDGSVSLINIVLKPISDDNPNFIHYLLRSNPFIEEYYRNGRGLVADLWTTRYDELRNIFLPIPTPTEQAKIVAFLTWKTSEIAHFVKESRKEISELVELKDSLVFNATVRGIRQNAPMSQCSIEWIPLIPSHWDEIMLFQCAAEQSVSNKAIHHQNLLSLSYGKIVNKDINTSEGLLPSSFDTYQIVHDGNVILRLTDLQNDHKSLRVGLSTQTGIITSAYTCLKARENILPEYLYYLLHAYDISKVFYGMGGGVRQSIGYADIRRMVIPLPPLDEQQEIVDYCREEQAKIEQMIAGLKEEIVLVQELRTKTISDVVTGKVDVRDVEIPQYEPEADDSIDVEEENDEDSDEDNSDAVDEEVY